MNRDFTKVDLPLCKKNVEVAAWVTAGERAEVLAAADAQKNPLENNIALLECAAKKGVIKGELGDVRELPSPDFDKLSEAIVEAFGLAGSQKKSKLNGTPAP